MTYKLAILDDDLDDLETIYNLINDFFSLKSISVNIDKYDNTNDFPMNEKFDVLFLDIDIPNKSGLEIAKEYKTLHKHTLIVFITNHNELVYKACNIHPFDFIRKENLTIEIPMVLEEAIYKLTDLYPTVTFYVNGNAYVIRKESILYCESFNHSTEIHFNKSSIIVNQQLNSVSATINSNDFKRVGRSYLVNMKKVQKFEGAMLFIDYNYKIPISRRKKKKVLEYLVEVQKNVSSD